jgi:protein gp37
MSDKTGIQWTDATWNPIRGCSRVSEGCRNCYAEVVAARFSNPGQPYEGLARRTSNGGARWTGKIMFVEKHLEDPLHWKRPRRIFVNSMSDLFHEGVTDAQLDRIFGVMAQAQRHTFQVLTKRPERMLAYSNARLLGLPLPNVWLGVSVEDQKAADERIPLLFDTPAAVRFLSCEPLLGPVELSQQWRDYLAGWNVREQHHPNCDGYTCDAGCPIAEQYQTEKINWVIVGGESGANARPCDTRWVRSLVDQCAAAGVAAFVKQLGAYPITDTFAMTLNDSHGGNPEEWAPFLRVREFPVAV